MIHRCSPVINAMRVPSGDHTGLLVSNMTSDPAVKFVSPLPSTLTTNMSYLPVRLDANATFVPSADQLGWALSFPAAFERLIAPEPSGFVTHTCLRPVPSSPPENGGFPST